jgi:succinyl-CoA synthetase beta subunit
VSKLLEHEVKALLADLGVAVPEGILVDADGEHGALTDEAGTFFVKAQIAAGDRAKAGGVVRTNGLVAARAAAAEMLGREIRGTRVDSVLIERGAMGPWEGYAAVTVVENPPRRVLVFSTEGGAGFDPATAHFRLTLSDGPQAYRIRRELRRIGVPSHELTAVTTFLNRLVDCALTWSAYTVETNPITFVDGAVVALDAKADLDDYSKAFIPRPELLDRPEQDARERAARDCQQGDHRGSLRYVQLIPESAGRNPSQVASHSVGGGESMVVLDALAAAGLSATNYCDTSGSPSAAKVATGAGLVAGQTHVDGLLFSTCIANQDLSITAEGLLAGWDSAQWRGPTVVRFAGNQSDRARQMVRDWAALHDVQVVVLGEESDEWHAAAALAGLVTEGARA